VSEPLVCWEVGVGEDFLLSSVYQGFTKNFGCGGGGEGGLLVRKLAGSFHFLYSVIFLCFDLCFDLVL